MSVGKDRLKFAFFPVYILIILGLEMVRRGRIYRFCHLCATCTNIFFILSLAVRDQFCKASLEDNRGDLRVRVSPPLWVSSTQLTSLICICVGVHLVHQ